MVRKFFDRYPLRIVVGYNTSYTPIQIVESGLTGILASGWRDDEARAVAHLLINLSYERFYDFITEFSVDLLVDPRDLGIGELALYIWRECRNNADCLRAVAALSSAITFRDAMLEGKPIDERMSIIATGEVLKRVASSLSDDYLPNVEYVVIELAPHLEGYTYHSFDKPEIVTATMLLHANLRRKLGEAIIDLRPAILPVVAAPSREAHRALAIAYA